jgi:hypothetical protein
LGYLRGDDDPAAPKDELFTGTIQVRKQPPKSVTIPSATAHAAGRIELAW